MSKQRNILYSIPGRWECQRKGKRGAPYEMWSRGKKWSRSPTVSKPAAIKSLRHHTSQLMVMLLTHFRHSMQLEACKGLAMMMRTVSIVPTPPHASQLGTVFCKTLTAQQLITRNCSGQSSMLSALLPRREQRGDSLALLLSEALRLLCKPLLQQAADGGCGTAAWQEVQR